MQTRRYLSVKVQKPVNISKPELFPVNLLSLLRFTEQSGLLMAATAMASLLAYLLQVLLARGLSVADFGTFGTLQALIYIAAVPVNTILTVAAHFIAGYRVSRPVGAVSTFIRGLRRELLPWGLGVAVVILPASPWLAKVLDLPSPWLISIGAAAMVMLAALSVERGGLLGLELVGHLSLNTTLEAVARLTFCLVPLWLGWGLGWVWLGWGAAYLVATLAAWPVVQRNCRAPVWGTFDRAAVRNYTLPVVAGTGLLALMMHVDMLFVNVFFSRVTAGAYAATLVYARAGLLPAMAIAPLTLSATTAQHHRGQATADLLGLSLVLAALPASLSALLALLAPQLVVTLLFGLPYAAAGPWLAPLALAYGLMALLYVYVRYSLAIGNFSFLKILAPAALAEVVAFLLFHQRVTDLIWILLAIFGVLALVFVLRFGLQVGW
jgi:O-antigen/teichoic acid export membrane protein